MWIPVSAFGDPCIAAFDFDSAAAVVPQDSLTFEIIWSQQSQTCFWEQSKAQIDPLYQTQQR